MEGGSSCFLGEGSCAIGWFFSISFLLRCVHGYRKKISGFIPSIGGVERTKEKISCMGRGERSPTIDGSVGERSNFKKFPMITQDLSRRCITTRQRVYLHTLEDRKVEAFINAVDVVVHLHDPSRSSIERMTHVQLDDVLDFLIQQ